MIRKNCEYYTKIELNSGPTGELVGSMDGCKCPQNIPLELEKKDWQYTPIEKCNDCKYFIQHEESKETPQLNMPVSLKHEIGKLFCNYYKARLRETPTNEDREELQYKYARKAIDKIVGKNYVDIDIDSMGKPSAKVWIESDFMEIQTVTKIGEYDYVVRIRPEYPKDNMDITLTTKP